VTSALAHVSFYRKWRPQAFEDVLGQDRVTRTLQNAIAGGRIVHAYLFCGHRGTGKTTTARILAKALNCARGPTPTPDNTCASCLAIGSGTSLDVIEIDAASNRGIDEIRDLREKVRLVPVQGRYKVYIIDEAHMLTAEAANALLKTLEEPPPHAVLILVTTEPHRLPATITSRTQRFEFKRIPQTMIVERLRTIASREGIAVEEDALSLIARSADGALRDAESLLDQLNAFCRGTIRKADVLAVLGVIDEEVAQEITNAVLAGDAARCLTLAGRVLEEGRDARQILRSLVEQLRDLLVVAIVPEPEGIVETTESRLAALRAQSAGLAPATIVQKIRILAAAEADARFAPQPRVVLEMALLRAARPEMDASVEGLAARIDALERRGSLPSGGRAGGRVSRSTTRELRPDAEARRYEERLASAPGGVKRGASQPDDAPPTSAPAPPSVGAGDAASMSLSLVQARWGQIMEEVKQRTRKVHALLLEGGPQEVTGAELVLGVHHRFHMERLQEAKSRAAVEDALARVLGVSLRLRVVLDEAGALPPEPSAAADTQPAADTLVREAIRRFGEPVQEIRPAE
jgi:DNA polymerase-3 subunit gamma/tau